MHRRPDARLYAVPAVQALRGAPVHEQDVLGDVVCGRGHVPALQVADPQAWTATGLDAPLAGQAITVLFSQVRADFSHTVGTHWPPEQYFDSPHDITP